MTIEWKNHPNVFDHKDDKVAEVGPICLHLWDGRDLGWCLAVAFRGGRYVTAPTRAAAEAKAEEVLAALRGALGEGGKP